MTNYPAAIDDSISLPLVVNNFTPIDNTAIDKLRSSVIAIQTELGVRPSGTAGTVRARIDNLESILGSINYLAISGDIGGTTSSLKVIGLQGHSINSSVPVTNDLLGFNGTQWAPMPATSFSTVTFSQDLSGSSSSQYVIGLQGRPINNTAPTNHQFLMWDTSLITPEWIPSNMYLDYLAASYALTLAATITEIETGDTLINPAFTATYANGTPSTALVSSSYDGYTQNVIATPTSFSLAHSYTVTSPDGYVNFTLTSDSTSPVFIKTTSSTVKWLQLAYWGAGAAGGATSGFITGLSNSTLRSQSNISGFSFTVTALANEKIYFAHRSAYGTRTLIVNSVSGGFTTSTVSVTNTFGVTENYILYESDFAALGLVTIEVI